MPQTPHVENHFSGSQYFRNIVIGISPHHALVGQGGGDDLRGWGRESAT